MGGFAAVLIIVWLVAVAIWWAISKFFKNSDIDRIKNRLVGVSKSKTAKSATQRSVIQEERKEGKIIQHLLRKYNLLPKLEVMIEQAGLKWTPARLIHGCLASFLIVFGIAWLMLPATFRGFAWLIGVLGGLLPLFYLIKARGSRLHRFEELFPDSLEFVARSMRAGHAFSVSLEMIHREFQEPLAGEFRRTFEEHNLGLPLEVALQKLAKRIPSLDVHFFVSAVLLQKRTGGNLAEILDKLAYIIRERFKLRGRIRAVSAHGKMTGTALTLIPLGVAVLMFYVNPDYVKFFFTDETGNIMMGAAVVLQLIGYGIIKKIVSIEV